MAELQQQPGQQDMESQAAHATNDVPQAYRHVSSGSLDPATAALPSAPQSPVTPLRSSLKSPTITLSSVPSLSSDPTAASGSASYETRVSFDASAEPAIHGAGLGVTQAFSLRRCSHGFVRNKQSRSFLCCTDMSGYSQHALYWALDSLIEDGDELVILRVLDDYLPAPTASPSSIAMSTSGSTSQQGAPLQPSLSTGAHTKSVSDSAREEAQQIITEVMEHTEALCGVTVEFAVGNVENTIQKMVQVYKPDSIVVGTRARDGLLAKAFVGSVSRYAVQHSPVPVIVVKPDTKTQKRRARRADRQSYATLVDHQSSAWGTTVSRCMWIR